MYVHRPIATDLLGTITRNLDDLQAKHCIFKRDGSIIPVHESPPLIRAGHSQSSDSTPESNGIKPLCSPHLPKASNIKSIPSLKANSFHSDGDTDFKYDPAVVDPDYTSGYGPLHGEPVEPSDSDLVSYISPDDRNGCSSFEHEQEKGDPSRRPSFPSSDDASLNDSLWSPPPNSSECSYSTLEELAISSLTQHTINNSNGSCYPDTSLRLSDSLANAVIAVASTALLVQTLAQERRLSLSDQMDDDIVGHSTDSFTSQKAVPHTNDLLGADYLVDTTSHIHTDNRQPHPLFSPPPKEAAPRPLLEDCHLSDTSHFPSECPPGKVRPMLRFDQPCSHDEQLFKSPPNTAPPQPLFGKSCPATVDKAPPQPLFGNSCPTTVDIAPQPLFGNSCPATVSNSLDASYHDCNPRFDHFPRPVSLFADESPQPREHISPQTTLPTEPVPLFSSLSGPHGSAVPVDKPQLPLVDHDTRNQHHASSAARTVVPLPDPASLACNQKQACDTVLEQLHFHLQSQRICHSELIEIKGRAFKKVSCTGG